MLLYNHNPRLDKTLKMTPVIKAVRTPYKHCLLHYPNEMHDIKIHVRKTLRSGPERRHDLNPMRWMQPTSKQLLFETRHLHRIPSATMTAVSSFQGYDVRERLQYPYEHQ